MYACVCIFEASKSIFEYVFARLTHKLNQRDLCAYCMCLHLVMVWLNISLTDWFIAWGSHAG